ncbi:hypothetical protein K438DRAFT_2162248 [Mycena galopus ATCC 62051]|nr:hypothetical protein K438DRAFT_2162248 [Mycena galopus ATCC 62051]
MYAAERREEQADLQLRIHPEILSLVPEREKSDPDLQSPKEGGKSVNKSWMKTLSRQGKSGWPAWSRMKTFAQENVLFDARHYTQAELSFEEVRLIEEFCDGVWRRGAGLICNYPRMTISGSGSRRVALMVVESHFCPSENATRFPSATGYPTALMGTRSAHRLCRSFGYNGCQRMKFPQSINAKKDIQDATRSLSWLEL